MTINCFQKKWARMQSRPSKMRKCHLCPVFLSWNINSRRFEAPKECWPSKPPWSLLRNLFTALCLSFILQRYSPPSWSGLGFSGRSNSCSSTSATDFVHELKQDIELRSSQNRLTTPSWAIQSNTNGICLYSSKWVYICSSWGLMS